jgi:hypothetical protein
MSVTDEVQTSVDNEELRRTIRNLEKQLRRQKMKTDELVDATIEAATGAVLAHWTPTKTPTPALGRAASKLTPEVAHWATGDWQYSKLTASYNSDIADRRVRQFAQKCLDLTALHRKAVPVNDCVITFGGDMIEGLFNFPTQAFEIDATLFEQFVRVSNLLVEIVKTALANYKHVTVVPEWGNHGRIGSKRDVVPRSDNIDRMCYQYAKGLLANETRLTWQDCPEDVQRLEIGNYRALVIHGDEIGRNGFAAPGTIVQHINKWRSGAYRVNGEPWEFQDVFIHHYHTHAEWAMANGVGTVFQTGSTESDNRYASVGLASTAIPSQRLHFINPEKGLVTAQYKVRLD